MVRGTGISDKTLFLTFSRGEEEVFFLESLYLPLSKKTIITGRRGFLL